MYFSFSRVFLFTHLMAVDRLRLHWNTPLILIGIPFGGLPVDLDFPYFVCVCVCVALLAPPGTR